MCWIMIQGGEVNIRYVDVPGVGFTLVWRCFDFVVSRFANFVVSFKFLLMVPGFWFLVCAGVRRFEGLAWI